MSLQVQVMLTHVLETGTVPHQSCRTWLLSGIYKGLVNDGLLFHIDGYRVYKNGKLHLSISLSHQRSLSLQEFRYTLHDPRNKGITLLITILSTEYSQFLSSQLGLMVCKTLRTHVTLSSFHTLHGAAENIWTKEGWCDGRVEKTA
jgi:hypothetical protein